MDSGLPEDAVEVGRILGAWGIKGWIRVQPFSGDPQALFGSKHWFLKAPEPGHGGTSLKPDMVWPATLRVSLAKVQGDSIVASIHDLTERNGAEALRGGRLFVARSSFPSADMDEFYWVDLIGLNVRNREGQHLGQVVGLLDTGAHSVLRVQAVDVEADAAPASATAAAGAVKAPASDTEERLIPFVSAYVDAVDLPGRLITVDWGLDY